MIGGLLTLLGNLILIVVIGVALISAAFIFFVRRAMRLRVMDPRDRVCALLTALWLRSLRPVILGKLLLARLIFQILRKFRSLRLRPAKTDHHR